MPNWFDGLLTGFFPGYFQVEPSRICIKLV